MSDIEKKKKMLDEETEKEIKEKIESSKMRTNMKIKKRIRYIYFSTYNNYNLCIN